MSRELVLRRVLVDAWPALLAIVLTWPLLTGSGYPLARDLIFVPRQPFTDASVGLGPSAPRAVPLDAVVSVMTYVLDGGVLARAVLPLLLASAGWGAHRVLGGLGLTGRLAAAGLAVWNPFVVERMVLGQWALLLAYAALPWIVLFGTRWRRERAPGTLAAALAWVAVASLTPTGGLLGAATLLTTAADRSRRTAAVVAGCVLLQLPWLVPSLVGTAAATSDPDAVAAFAASPEGPGGVLTALVGFGGIWDARSVPTTRESWWAPATALVVLLGLMLGRRVLLRALGRDATTRLGVLAAVGLALAATPATAPGRHVVAWLVREVPGAGLLRDSQKFLALFVVVAVAALGALVHRLVRSLADGGHEWSRDATRAVAGLALAAPVILLPDGALGGTWDTLEPVHYPAGFDAVANRVAEEPGDLAVLPWRSYRGFSWGNGETSSDPAVRWFDRDVVVADDLQVGGTLVSGEDPRAARLGAALGKVAPATVLAEEGVAWALVYVDDPEADDLDLAGLTEVYRDDDMALYRVARPAPSPPGPSNGARALVAVGDVLALLLALVSVGLGIASGRKVLRRSPGHRVGDRFSTEEGRTQWRS